MALPFSQVVRMGVPRLDDKDLAGEQSHLLSIQLAKIWAAFHQDRLVAAVTMFRIFVIPPHVQAVEIGKNRLEGMQAMSGMSPVVASFIQHLRLAGRQRHPATMEIQRQLPKPICLCLCGHGFSGGLACMLLLP